MLSIFLQWEQEGSRSDALAFCRKGRSRLTSSGTDCGTEQGQGEQLQGIGAEGCRRRGSLRERGQSTFQPLWGRVRSLVLCVCVSTGTPLLPALLSLRQPRGQQGHAIMGIKSEVPTQAGWECQARCSSILCAAKGSSQERDTGARGTCQEPGASSQNKSYSLSTELCHLYPEKD